MPKPRKKRLPQKRKTKPSKTGNASRRPGSVLWSLLFRLLLLLLLAIGGLLFYFDRKIQQHFDSGVHPEPAHLYARGPHLTTRDGLSMDRVIGLLESHGYRRSKRIDGPGSYVVANSRMDLHPIALVGHEEQAYPVRLEFSNGGLTRILRHSDGGLLDAFSLQPTAIGSLQLGPYEDRITLKLHQMPELLVRALLAMEDRNFESHIGIDLLAIGRALINNVFRGDAIQGGSTITQQLVKNLFLSPERSLSRKVTEALMAITMEVRYSKAEILELYLNEIFLGQAGNRAVHGFALASEYYFARPLDQLRLHESALLVGLIPAPSFYNPHRHPERALSRRNLVLTKLAEVGAITTNTAETLSGLPLGVVPHRNRGGGRYPAYVDYLHRQIRQYFAEDVLRRDGIRLYTTLDTNTQDIAQRALSQTLEKLEAEHGITAGVLQGAAIVVEVASGDILALVGDRKAGYSGFNRAVDAQRPIGSLVKPLVYLTALERPNRFNLGSLVDDAPITVESPGGAPWSPQNYDRTYRGPVTLLEALTRSYNVPTVRLGMDVGIEPVAETISRLGVRKSIPRFPSLLLGANEHSPLEIAQLYQSIANDGKRIPLRAIGRIDDRNGREIARFPSRATRVIEPGPAYLIDFALRQVVQRGTASRLSSRFPAALGIAGKTGTTDNYRDSWFAGYSGNRVTVVWVGRDDNRPIGLTGAGGAMRVWENIMMSLDLAPAVPQTPENIKNLEIDPASGLLAFEGCDDRIRIPVMDESEIKKYAPCAGLVGKVHNWFSIQVAEPDTGGSDWNTGADNRR